MRRLVLSVAVLLVLVISVLASNPAAAEFKPVQRATWGLEGEGNSAAVGSFSSLGWALEESDGRLFVGGKFMRVTSVAQSEQQPYLAAFDIATGTFDATFRPNVDKPVLTMATAPDGGLFLGGEIGTYDGRSVGSLVKIDPVTGDIWPGWNTKISNGGSGSNIVREVSLEPDGWLYAVGSFKWVSDSNGVVVATSAIRMDPNSGAVDRSWTPSVGATSGGGSVWGVSVSRTNGTVYLAGWKLIVNGFSSSVVGVSSIDGDQNTWTGFTLNSQCCGNMYDVEATEFGTVFVAGEQHGLYVYDENNGTSLISSHVTSYDSRFQDSDTRRGGDYQELERVGDRMYATCHCWGSHSSMQGSTLVQYSSDLATIGGTPTGSISGIGAYDIRTGVRDQTFNPYMAGDIGGFGVLQDSFGCLWIAGGIDKVGPIGNQQAGRDLVRLCD